MGVFFGQTLVQSQGFGDLVADRVNRVQGRHRLLEDHRYFITANPAHLVLRKGQQTLAFE